MTQALVAIMSFERQYLQATGMSLSSLDIKLLRHLTTCFGVERGLRLASFCEDSVDLVLMYYSSLTLLRHPTMGDSEVLCNAYMDFVQGMPRRKRDKYAKPSLYRMTMVGNLSAIIQVIRKEIGEHALLSQSKKHLKGCTNREAVYR